MKPKKDKLFIIIAALVLANLVYFFAGAVSAFVTTRYWWAALWIFADGIAIIGVLYLVRNYKRNIKREKHEREEKEAREKEERDNKNFN